MLKLSNIFARSLPAVLLALILTASGGVARAGFAKGQSSAQQTAPAIVQDKSEDLQRSILAKLEFEELNLQLTGVTSTQGKPTCSIKHPGSTEQMVYGVGDVIGGYRIAAIQDQQVKFERSGREFFLMMGESSGGHDMLAEAAPSSAVETKSADTGLKKQPSLAGMDDASGAAQPDASTAGIVEKRDLIFKEATTKLAKVNLKTKTRRFESAKLIEDGFAVRDLASGRQPANGRNLRMVASAGTVSRISGSSGSGFMAPIQGELSSEYGYRRHPIGGDWRFHRGIDIAGPYGSPIYSAADGVVTRVEQTYSLGRHIVIQHSSGFETVYGHLSSQLVQVGQRIRRGALIGREGNTGNSTGPHLHFEIHFNGQTVNPINYLRGLH